MKQDKAVDTIPTPNIPILPLRVVKISTCPTNSDRATLAYQIGCTPEYEIYFRVTANIGGGLFSTEWVSLKSMLARLEVAPKPIASYLLLDLLKGKSINTPALLMAAMKNEGIVRSLDGKIRGYEILDNEPFMTEMKALIDTGVNLIVKDIPSHYKTSVTLNKNKVVKEPSPKEVKLEQRKIKTLLSQQKSNLSKPRSLVVLVRRSKKINRHNARPDKALQISKSR
jgi:hypothetical protein